MLDSLLISLSTVCNQILPILGAIVLVFLCIAIKKVWKLIDSINHAVEKAEPTIDLVDKTIEKVQGPLDTVNKYSNSLDNLHDKAVDSMSKAAEYASENLAKAKSAVSESIQKVNSAFNKNDNSDSINVFDNKKEEDVSKDLFARDQKLYDEVAKYTSSKEEKNNE